MARPAGGGHLRPRYAREPRAACRRARCCLRAPSAQRPARRLTLLPGCRLRARRRAARAPAPRCRAWKRRCEEAFAVEAAGTSIGPPGAGPARRASRRKQRRRGLLPHVCRPPPSRARPAIGAAALRCLAPRALPPCRAAGLRLMAEALDLGLAACRAATRAYPCPASMAARPARPAPMARACCAVARRAACAHSVCFRLPALIPRAHALLLTRPCVALQAARAVLQHAAGCVPAAVANALRAAVLRTRRCARRTVVHL